jgi:hypothetical protein
MALKDVDEGTVHAEGRFSCFGHSDQRQPRHKRSRPDSLAVPAHSDVIIEGDGWNLPINSDSYSSTTGGRTSGISGRSSPPGGSGSSASTSQLMANVNWRLTNYNLKRRSVSQEISS